MISPGVFLVLFFLIQFSDRPGHDAQVVAHTHAITHTNQEKKAWMGDKKPTLR